MVIADRKGALGGMGTKVSQYSRFDNRRSDPSSRNRLRVEAGK